MSYAARTTVSVEQSRTEIERTLSKYGAKSFAYFTEDGRAIIVFEASDHRLACTHSNAPGQPGSFY